MSTGDALLVAADRLDYVRPPEILAAREVLLRAADHDRNCPSCSAADVDLLELAAEVVLVMGDERIDSAVIDLARELKRSECRRAVA